MLHYSLLYLLVVYWKTLPAAQMIYHSMKGWFVNNELEMDNRDCPCFISPMGCPTWRGTPSKDVHCILYQKTYRTLKQLLEITSPNYQACFTPGEYFTKNCLQWLSTYYLHSVPQNFCKIVVRVCTEIDFKRPVPKKNQPHISHMASELVNKQVPQQGRTVAPFCSRTRTHSYHQVLKQIRNCPKSLKTSDTCIVDF